MLMPEESNAENTKMDAETVTAAPVIEEEATSNAEESVSNAEAEESEMQVEETEVAHIAADEITEDVVEDAEPVEIDANTAEEATIETDVTATEATAIETDVTATEAANDVSDEEKAEVADQEQNEETVTETTETVAEDSTMETEETQAEVETQSQSEPAAPKKRFRMFVGKVKAGTTTEQFNAYWKALDVEPLHLKVGTPRPFGFIVVDSIEKRDEIMNGSHTINGMAVNIHPAKPKTKKFFLGGIPKTTTDEEVKNLFAKYGTVSEGFAVKGRGFGFVTLESDDPAINFRNILQNEFILGGRAIDVKFAQPKPENGQPQGFGRNGPPRFMGAYNPYQRMRGGYGGRQAYGGFRGGYGAPAYRGGYGGRRW